MAAELRPLSPVVVPCPDALRRSRREMREGGGSIPAMFREVVSQCPDRTAVQTSDHHWTYAELDGISDKVAHAFAGAGRTSQPVGILMDHGARPVAAILGALKAGRPYVALNPYDPPARHQLIQRDVDSAFIITDHAWRDHARAVGPPAEPLLFDEVAAGGATDASVWVGEDEAAVITYTSGTTGAPKGVVQTHRNIINQVERYNEAAALEAADRFALVTPYSYAAALSPFFGALLTGGVLLPFDLKRHGIEALGRWLAETNVTIVQTVPTVFRALCRQGADGCVWPALRLVRLGGDAALASDLELFRQAPFSDACRLMVGFSSTETGLVRYELYGRCSQVRERVLPVRQPVGDVAVHLVDERGESAPEGQCGRMIVSSAYFSPGYWERRDLTRQSFGEAHATGGIRTYDTGDLARRTSDGGLVHLGRADRRVKIGGQRIELDEVEAALLALPGVSEAAVELRHRRVAGSPRLIGCVVPAGPGDAMRHDWQNELRRHLPDHMVPARIITLKQMPRLPNGKIDRHHLRTLANDRTADATGGRMPQAELDRKLVRAWERCLNVCPIGMDDDFFALGGDSIRAVSLSLEVEADFGCHLPPSALIEAPTVRQYADRLSREIFDSMRTPLVRVREGGNRRPLFLVHALDGGVFWSSALARHLPHDQSVYGLQSPALYGDLKPLRSIRRLASHYIEQILAVQPNGKCVVAGYCMGGMIAMEIARQLTCRGMRPGPVLLIDTPLVSEPPRWRARFTQRLESRRLRLRWLGRRWRLHLEPSARRRERLLYTQAHRLLVQRLHHVLLRGHHPPGKLENVVCLKAEQTRQRDGVDAREQLVRALKPRPELITVPGDHLSCIREPHLPRLAAVMQRVMGCDVEASS